MAGSRKNFQYIDDLGNSYAIELDESNTEAVNGTDNDIPDAGAINIGIPKNIQVRELFYTNQARTRTIRCVALAPQIYQNILQTTPSSTIPDPITQGATLTLVRARGERRRIYLGIDTGQDDGDAT